MCIYIYIYIYTYIYIYIYIYRSWGSLQASWLARNAFGASIHCRTYLIIH